VKRRVAVVAAGSLLIVGIVLWVHGGRVTSDNAHAQSTPSASTCWTASWHLLQASQVGGMFVWTTAQGVRPPWDGPAQGQNTLPAFESDWINGTQEGLLSNITKTDAYLKWQAAEAAKLGMASNVPLLPLRGPIVSGNPNAPLEIWEKSFSFSTPSAAQSWARVVNTVGYSPSVSSYASYRSAATGSDIPIHIQDVGDTPDGLPIGRFYDAAVVLQNSNVVTLEIHGGRLLPIATAATIIDAALIDLQTAC
jgi:hypothetical protein